MIPQEDIKKAIERIVEDMAEVEPQDQTLDFILTKLCERFSQDGMSGLFCKFSDCYGDCGLCRYNGNCADGLKESYLNKEQE